MSAPITEALAEVRDRAAQAQATIREARLALDEAVGTEVRRLCTELRARREELGLTQQDVSTAIGITRSQIANVEAGRGTSVETLVGYAAAVGWSVRFSA